MEPSKEIADTKLRSESELRQLLVNFMPGSKSHARTTLIEGFEVIKKRIIISEKLDKIDYEKLGDIQPAPLHINLSISTLDNFIKKRMGGERVDLKIKWEINGKQYWFDPWSGNLEDHS